MGGTWGLMVKRSLRDPRAPTPHSSSGVPGSTEAGWSHVPQGPLLLTRPLPTGDSGGRVGSLPPPLQGRPAAPQPQPCCSVGRGAGRDRSSALHAEGDAWRTRRPRASRPLRGRGAPTGPSRTTRTAHGPTMSAVPSESFSSPQRCCRGAPLSPRSAACVLAATWPRASGPLRNRAQKGLAGCLRRAGRAGALTSAGGQRWAGREPGSPSRMRRQLPPCGTGGAPPKSSQLALRGERCAPAPTLCRLCPIGHLSPPNPLEAARRGKGTSLRLRVGSAGGTRRGESVLDQIISSNSGDLRAAPSSLGGPRHHPNGEFGCGMPPAAGSWGLSSARGGTPGGGGRLGRTEVPTAGGEEGARGAGGAGA